MPDQIQKLAADVGSKLRQLGYRRPTNPQLTVLLRTAYLASLRTEEGQFLRGSITVADPAQPEDDPPPTIRASYPSFAHFGARKPFTVANLVKFSRAIDPWSGSISVYGSNRSDIFMWGVVDQLVQENTLLNHEDDSGFSNPGVITIKIDGVGVLSVYHGHIFLGGLNGDRITTRENVVLLSNQIFSRISPHYVDVRNAIHRVLSASRDLDEIEDRLFYGWVQVISRICIGLRRFRTGGSLVITSNPLKNGLIISQKFGYKRLGDSMILKVMDDFYARQMWEECRSYEVAIPKNLYLDEMFADADANDRASEVGGAVKLVTSLAAVDGVVVLSPMLHVVGFGVKISSGGSIRTVYDGAGFSRKGTAAKHIDVASFGTRHNSMLRYCRADRSAIGIIVSQDGSVRIAISSNSSLTLWEDVKLLSHQNFTASIARQEQKRRNKSRKSGTTSELGYSETPKRVRDLLRIK